MVLGGESGATTAAGTGATAAVRPSARLVPQTVVSVQVRGLGKGRSRAVAVTRPAAMGMAQAAVTPRVRTAVGQKGEIGRHLVMSLSISSGKEESRRFSVPRRVLRPHFQLFEGSAAVIEDENGGYRLGRQDLRTQRGQVWFV